MHINVEKTVHRDKSVSDIESGAAIPLHEQIMLEREHARRKRLGLDVPPAIIEIDPNQNNMRGANDLEYGSSLGVDIIDVKELVSDGSSIEGDGESGSEKGNRGSGADQDRRPRVRIQEAVSNVGRDECESPSPMTETPGSGVDAPKAAGGEEDTGGHKKGLGALFGFGR